LTQARTGPKTIDGYIDRFPTDIQAILERIRQTIRAAAPDAEESISYGMPMFRMGGAVAYFAAFKKHIGLYPPVVGDANLMKAIAPYAGPKGNLQFPLDQPIPYALVQRIVKARVCAIGERGAPKRRSQKH
jgi:uncharacterized protein YdhG (YjbR/CyaY superfamily)